MKSFIALYTIPCIVLLYVSLIGLIASIKRPTYSNDLLSFRKEGQT